MLWLQWDGSEQPMEVLRRVEETGDKGEVLFEGVPVRRRDGSSSREDAILVGLPKIADGEWIAYAIPAAAIDRKDVPLPSRLRAFDRRHADSLDAVCARLSGGGSGASSDEVRDACLEMVADFSGEFDGRGSEYVAGLLKRLCGSASVSSAAIDSWDHERRAAQHAAEHEAEREREHARFETENAALVDRCASYLEARKGGRYSEDFKSACLELVSAFEAENPGGGARHVSSLFKDRKGLAGPVEGTIRGWMRKAAEPHRQGGGDGYCQAHKRSMAMTWKPPEWVCFCGKPVDPLSHRAKRVHGRVNNLIGALLCLPSGRDLHRLSFQEKAAESEERYSDDDPVWRPGVLMRWLEKSASDNGLGDAEHLDSAEFGFVRSGAVKSVADHYQWHPEDRASAGDLTLDDWRALLAGYASLSEKLMAAVDRIERKTWDCDIGDNCRAGFWDCDDHDIDCLETAAYAAHEASEVGTVEPDLVMVELEDQQPVRGLLTKTELQALRTEASETAKRMSGMVESLHHLCSGTRCGITDLHSQ